MTYISQNGPATVRPSAPATRSRSASTEPVVAGFYPDPTVCRVGDDYYLSNSSFEYFPGAPIFHSTDLVTWSQVGNILDRRSQFRHGVDLPSTGIYGSTLRFHDARFWFITTNVSDFESGQLIVSAEDPAGPWSEPVFVPEATGIDPDLSWDEDGSCYLTWNALDFADGGRGIRQAPIDLATGRLLAPDYPIWQGTGLLAPEGPHLYKIGQYWYLVLAEGGTERGHCVTVARSTEISGPFEACPWNPVFTHRSTGHAVQNVGHADLVEAPDGGWAALYLAARPTGPTPGFHVIGRETFLAGVDWLDEWPVIDEDRFEFAPRDTAFTDDFRSQQFALNWVTPTGEPARVAVPRSEGGLIFTPSNGSANGDDLLCTRVQDLRWSVDAEFIGSGRLQVRIDDRHWYQIEFQGGLVTVTTRVGDFQQAVATATCEAGRLILRISATEPSGGKLPFGHGGPDDIQLSFSDGQGDHELARLDGRYLSTEVAGGFTGRVIGLGSAGGDSILTRFSYQPV
ncbi:family 43 glycosylhydrolase [Microbacterium sp. X-17]|uniref:glycoside hydrolase family 43 protein n=1 Tax=Microbacterium sp. X-17 TaxID=3144404 RepID=UPI0031F57E74